MQRRKPPRPPWMAGGPAAAKLPHVWTTNAGYKRPLIRSRDLKSGHAPSLHSNGNSGQPLAIRRSGPRGSVGLRRDGGALRLELAGTHPADRIVGPVVGSRRRYVTQPLSLFDRRGRVRGFAARVTRRLATVLGSPASNPTVGVQPRCCRASPMSGHRCFGSSSGSGR